MLPNDKDEQSNLAEEFRLQDYRLIQESKIAHLKIQSWQFAVRTPEIGVVYLNEAAKMIKQSLLTYIPNTFVLNQVGYYLDVTGN